MYKVYCFLGSVLLYTSISFPLLFIYRYIIVCKGEVYGHLITNRNIGIVICFAMIICIINYTFNVLGELPADFLLERLNQTDPGMYYDPDTLFGCDYIANPLVSVSLGMVAICSCISYIIIVLCAKRITTMLNSQVTFMSKTTREGHLSLVRALLVQSFLPLVCIIPALLNFIITIFFGAAFEFQNYLGCTLMLWMAVCDPLLTIWFVHPYRKAIFPWLNNRVTTINDRLRPTFVSNRIAQNVA